MKTILATLLAVALLATAGAVAVVRSGWYDVAATTSHTVPIYRMLETSLRHSVEARAASIQAPRLDDAARIDRGAACYRSHCVQCHGGPGTAPGDIGMGMEPAPGPLVDAARRWRPGEIYWIVRHGIKMSGMPAWELRLSDGDLWAVTAFVQHLAVQSPADYRQAMSRTAGQSCDTASAQCRAGACAGQPTADRDGALQRDRAEQARTALRQYACVTCHRVAGSVGPDTHVGPPLEQLWRRERIAGRLPNDVDSLTRWIRSPQSVDPETAMPDMGVTEEHARLIAEHLLMRPRP